MKQELPYYAYSQYLKDKYGEKVYKLPVNLPVSCPNRLAGKGCAFCAGQGTGFEAMDSRVPVKEQLEKMRQRFFIAIYFFWNPVPYICLRKLFKFHTALRPLF